MEGDFIVSEYDNYLGRYCFLRVVARCRDWRDAVEIARCYQGMDPDLMFRVEPAGSEGALEERLVK